MYAVPMTTNRGGHIPGAVNLVWLEVLTGGDAVYTTDSQWRARLEDRDVEVFKAAADGFRERAGI
jgi:3-mercaptopyruvate sulfurtransferase SseA